MSGSGVLRPAYLALILSLAEALAAQEAPLRAGIIGLDTSHAVAFTRLLNDPDATGPRARIQVTAAFPGGSPDIASSRERLAGFTAEIRTLGVRIVDSIPDLLAEVDVVLLESVDGRPHLDQARLVIEAGKPLFIDKPLAGTFADCMAIANLARERGLPWFSSSSLRFSPGILAMREKVGTVLGCDAFGPCTLEPNHPDLFWYGIHGVEILFTIMGPGCVSVRRTQTADFEQVTGVWEDGRIGTFRGIRSGKSGYGAMVFGSEGIERSGEYAGYAPLVEEIARFFVSRRPPVPVAETLEIYAFMAAADLSRERGGAPVSVAEVRRAAGTRDDGRR
jgi:predicted dehydrogenase